MTHPSSDARPVRQTTRREFLKTSATTVAASPFAGLALGAAVPVTADQTIRIGLIGCGGRGLGAVVNAMNADPGLQLVAMGDLLMERVKAGRDQLKQQFPGRVAVKEDACFDGFQCHQGVIDAVDVVLIANAAKFHPYQLMAAVQSGKHVFVEKPHAIDPAGIKMVQQACRAAQQKSLCVVSGLQSRYHPGYQETLRLVHDGAIGEIVSIEENFLRAPYVLYPRKAGMTEAQYQGSNQYHFHWLSGDDVPQSLVHNLDRASWALGNVAPLKAHGMGGRSTLRGAIYGSVFDHHAVVYEFPGGVRLYAFCRTIPDCYNEVSSILLGSKGKCDLLRMEITGETNWKYEGEKYDPYLLEHVELFKAVRAGQALNNGEYMARSTLIAIMGQLSCYTGKEMIWEQVSNSDFYFEPKAEDCRIDMKPPVLPTAEGTYPVYVPGVTRLI